jgi:flagellar hook-length control protein FliK
MISIPHVDKTHSALHQMEQGKDYVQGKDEEFNTLLNQLMYGQNEERVIQKEKEVEPNHTMRREVKQNEEDSPKFQDRGVKEGLLKHKKIQKKRVSSKKTVGPNYKSKVNRNSFVHTFREKAKRGLLMKEMVDRGEREQKDKRVSTRSLNDVHISEQTNNRKLFITSYSAKRGRKLRQVVSTKIKKDASEYVELKKDVSEKIKPDVKITREVGSKSDVKRLGESSVSLSKAFSDQGKMEGGQPLGIFSKAFETEQHGNEISFASLRYEKNVPKVLIKQDYQIAKTADEIFNEIVQKFTLTVRKGGGEAHIVLQPEVLGKLKLNLKLNQNEVNSVIIVENQSVKDLIISKLNILEQNLLQHGFSLGSFHVEVNDKSAGFQNMTGRRIGNKENQFEPAVEIGEDTLTMASLPWISTMINVTA